MTGSGATWSAAEKRWNPCCYLISGRAVDMKAMLAPKTDIPERSALTRTLVSSTATSPMNPA